MNDPRISISQSALEAQLRFEQRMMAGMNSSYESFNQRHRLEAALEASEKKAQGAPRMIKLITDAKKVDKTIQNLASGRRGSFGLANRDLARHLDDMEFGDLRPTPSDLASAQDDCKEIDTSLAALKKLRTVTLPALNEDSLGQNRQPSPTSSSLPIQPA